MTAIAQTRTTLKFEPLHLLSLVLGVLMLIAFLALPWVQNPETGATTAQGLTATRDANPLEIPVQGLVLIPLAGLGAVLIGLWVLFSPQNSRTAALLTAITGMMSLTYYVIFFIQQQQAEANYLSYVSLGFWAVLIVGVLMIIQLALPRPVIPSFEISRVLGNQESVLSLALVVLVVVVGILNPRFLAERNISDILQGNAYIAVAALGMSMVIISGNIDISIGALMGVLAVVSGMLASNGYPIWLAWLAPLVLGGIFGAIIGFAIAYLKIPSIIVTLGVFSILKGGLIIVTGGKVIEKLPPEFMLAQMRPLGISMPIIFMVVMTIIVMLWLRYSGTGRAIYAIGGNADAARLSGISYQGMLMRVFTLHGIIAGVASLLLATQFNVIQATVPPGLELSIITASVVGGVSILGGVGTVIGSTVATVLLNAIRSAMIFINVSPFWLQAVQGILILATVLVDLLRRKRQLH